MTTNTRKLEVASPSHRLFCEFDALVMGKADRLEMLEGTYVKLTGQIIVIPAQEWYESELKIRGGYLCQCQKQ